MHAFKCLFKSVPSPQLDCQIDADDFGIVLGIKTNPALLVAAAKLMIVGDVAIVGDGQIGIAMPPEGLRMT